MQLDMEQVQHILDTGSAARQLLLQPAFHDVINTLSTFHLSALVAAPPGPSGLEAREYHHTMHTAIREIASEITARVDAADELSARLDSRSEQDEE